MSVVDIPDAHQNAPLLRLAYVAPAWKDGLDRGTDGRRFPRLGVVGNIVFLPAPVAGYRLRHAADGCVVEIVSRRGHVTHIGWRSSGPAARELLGRVWIDHARPILPEVGHAA